MMTKNRLARGVVVLCCVALTLSGCATAGKVKLQTVRVSVADEKGADLGAARCTLRNGAGEWQLAAPGLATVSVDGEPLRIQCSSEDGKRAGDASLERKNTTARNMLIGGSVGLLVGGAIGKSRADTRAENANPFDIGPALVAMLAGLFWGSVIGTGAGAATGEAGYADSVRVTLKPLPQPATP